MRAHAADARWVSSERTGDEVRRLVAGAQPTEGLRILERTGVLDVILPELAAQRGVPQAKIPGHDLWAHSLATLDAMAWIAPDDAVLRMAALLHDLGKPATSADGHFIGHAEVGGAMARALLARLHHPAREAERIGRLVEEHMFQYAPAWTDAAVRRFIRRVGPDLVDDLVLLRQADNVGSGLAPEAGDLADLRARVGGQLGAGVPLGLGDLAVDGNDLLAELDRPAGPWVGILLQRLLDSVIGDPSRNTRERLLADARQWASEVASGR
jgi:putative nucleotidyltransferase with HDIG domain